MSQGSRLFLVAVAIATMTVGACTVGTIGEFTENLGEGAGAPGTGGFGCDAEEICDGFDNDCDGSVDEDCPCDPGDTQQCYSGNPITVGIGNCQRGQQQCDDGWWGACQGESKPDEEICDTYDNDCDGLVDEDCPCEENTTQDCYTGNPVTVGIGACRRGQQTCTDATWGPCEGSISPTDEICNGLDDDCDGAADTDDLPADQLCPIVPNGTADCVAQECIVAGCDTDYADANGIYNDGCECLADPLTSEGATCSGAIDLGTLQDVNQDLLNITGNTGPPGRVVWYRFQASDDVDTAGDEFHVDVRFMINPSDHHIMAVYQGGCDGANLLGSNEISAFDWYTDFNRTSTGCDGPAPCGEGDCAVGAGEGQNECNDDSNTFYFSIERADGAASCDGYQLELSNGYR